jgi:hypothetical protein
MNVEAGRCLFNNFITNVTIPLAVHSIKSVVMKSLAVRSYEIRAIEKLARRYEADVESISNRLVNVNSQVYGKVYFPTRSNRLKELGRFINELTFT